jgi:hypothetical protein
VQFVHKAPEGSASGEKPFSHLRLWELDSFRRRRHTGAQPSTTPEALQPTFPDKTEKITRSYRHLESWSWWCKYTVICYSIISLFYKLFFYPFWVSVWVDYSLLY